MPELPEVETVREGLLPAMEGRVIARAEVNRPDLRWPLPERMAERITGARVERLRRRSKYILADLDTGESLLIHDRGRTERVPVSEVLYLKAELKYVTVRTENHEYLWSGSLNEIEERYTNRYLRVHRNALVVPSAIRSLEKTHDADDADGWQLRLFGIDDVLRVSRRQLPQVRALLANKPGAQRSSVA